MADMMYRNKFMKDKTFWTIQDVLKSGETSLELHNSEVESICKNLGIERFESVIVRYNGKLYDVSFEISDWGYDEICALERKVIDITD